MSLWNTLWRSPRNWQAKVTVCVLVLLPMRGGSQAMDTPIVSSEGGRQEGVSSTSGRTGAENRITPPSRTVAGAGQKQTVSGRDENGVANSQHIIKPGELLDVRVFNEEALSGRSRVAENGTVMLPLLGEVKVAGLAEDEARLRIHQLLAEDYLVTPRVMLTVVESAKPRFTILGQVERPGMYELPTGEDLDLLQAISLAGGFTRLANPTKTTLKRKVEGREVVKQLDAKAMAKGDKAITETILPGDAIYVPERLF